MSNVFFDNAARIIKQVFDFLQSSVQTKTANLISDTFTSGIDNATGSGEGFTLIPGSSSLSVTAQGQGIAYDSNGARIFLSVSDTTVYNPANVTQTTNDGLGNMLLTPQSSGCVNIPLTGSSLNYLWIDYLAITDTTAYTLNKITEAKLFYKIIDGYNIQVTTVLTPPDSTSIFLGTIDLTGISSGIIPSSTISQRDRTYFNLLSNIVPTLPALSMYRRPNLVFISTTVVGVETGLNGISGDGVILFSDGNLRVDSALAHIRMTITQNANWVSTTESNLKGGLDSSIALTINTWYTIYAVKATHFSSDWVLVATTSLPLQSNYASLNSNYGTNSWVYLGMIRYGDSSTVNNSILKFVQHGNTTLFYNDAVGAVSHLNGVDLASTGNNFTNFSWVYSNGTGSSSIPDNLGLVQWHWVVSSGNPSSGSELDVGSQVQSSVYYDSFTPTTGGRLGARFFAVASEGLKLFANYTGGQATAGDIFISGFIDSVLGVGSNPLL